MMPPAHFVQLVTSASVVNLSHAALGNFSPNEVKPLASSAQQAILEIQPSQHQNKCIVKIVQLGNSKTSQGNPSANS